MTPIDSPVHDLPEPSAFHSKAMEAVGQYPYLFISSDVGLGTRSLALQVAAQAQRRGERAVLLQVESSLVSPQAIEHSAGVPIVSLSDWRHTPDSVAAIQEAQHIVMVAEGAAALDRNDIAMIFFGIALRASPDTRVTMVHGNKAAMRRTSRGTNPQHPWPLEPCLSPRRNLTSAGVAEYTLKAPGPHSPPQPPSAAAPARTQRELAERVYEGLSVESTGGYALDLVQNYLVAAAGLPYPDLALDALSRHPAGIVRATTLLHLEWFDEPTGVSPIRDLPRPLAR